MNVALIAPRSTPYPGARERHVRELARGLVRRGAAVELLTQGHHSAMTNVRESHGVVERDFAVPSRNARLPIAPSLSDYLRRTAGSFDLVHAHCTQPLPALAAARARPRHLVFSPLAPMARLLRWPYAGATRAATYFATTTICMSRSDAALLRRALPAAADRIRVVPEGVNTGAIRDASPFPTVNTLVLAVGRLVRHKRVDRAIAAMAALVPTFELVVVGDGPARRRLKAHAADLQVSSRIRFTGQVPDAELDRWLKTARLLVTLSEEEAFGLQVLEGLAAGTPVVASDIPAHREAASFARSGMTLVSPEGSPLEVADAILSTTGIPVRAMAAGMPTWDDVVDVTLALYEGLAQHRLSTGARRARQWKTGAHESGGQGELVVKG